MKSFLVAIDFSNCSVNALLNAAQLAYITNSRLEMVWVNNPEKSSVNVESGASTGLIDEMNIQFKRLTDELQAKYNGLQVDYLIREGKVYKEVGSQALESESWLIVAGTHGRSGFEKFWIGSNVYRIITTAPCPVLTVRAGVSISDQMNTIILPIDSTPETREKVTITAEIARATKAKVIVLKLYSSKIKEVIHVVDAYANQVADFLRAEQVEVEMDESITSNLTDTTIEYAKMAKADLIVIMTEQEKKAANFLLGNFAQQMINHSPVPVLSVRPKGM